MSDIDHNPAHREAQRPRIGVRALLSASGPHGEHRPQVALVIPGAQRQIRLSAEEAGELAGRLLNLLAIARYDAAVYDVLGAHPAAPEVHQVLLQTLVSAGERLVQGSRGAQATGEGRQATEGRPDE